MSLRTLPRRVATVQRRAYAVASGHSAAAKDRDSTASDSRLDIIRKTLYPPQAATNDTNLGQSIRESPTSPTGTYHPDYHARLAHVLGPDPEIHETITRAWLSHQRAQREARTRDLQRKHASMGRACEALREADARLYAAAMVRPDVRKQSSSPALTKQPEGGKTSLAEKRWKQSRIEGLVPREAWVPRETWGGERWGYGWREVGAER